VGTAILQAFEQAFADIEPRPRAVDVAAAGLTGFDGSPEAARAVADGVRSLVRAGRVMVTNDAVTSYLGAIEFEPGVVVAAGTGVIAITGDRDGSFARSDGWGYMLGDDGGGYYIGRRGLACALRAYDGRGGSEALRWRAEKMFGSPGLIGRRVYGASNPASEVAKFAPEVAEAAREGDPVASEIWADAAREVALTATASLRQVFDPGATVAVSWTGSLFNARDLMLEPFKRHVARTWPSARFLAPKGTALHGAELLARSDLPRMFEALVHVFER
jgi:N-acetylglucosamine kinase-like BadF-type ATPase